MRKSARTIVVGLFALAIGWAWAPGTASALETELGMGAFAGFTIGASFLDTSGIEDYLEPADVDSFGTAHLDLGGEFTGILYDRVVLGMNAAFLVDDNEGPDLDVLLSAGSFHFYGGYLLFETHRLRGYPVLGLGYSNLNLRLDGDYTPLPPAQQAGVDYVSLDALGQGADARIATQEEISLNYGAMTAEAAFHLEFYHPIAGRPDSFAFMLTGVRLGYEVELFSTGWYLDGDSLHGEEPDFRFDRGFVRLIFGFGGGGAFERSHRRIYPEPDAAAQDDLAPEPERHQ